MSLNLLPSTPSNPGWSLMVKLGLHSNSSTGPQPAQPLRGVWVSCQIGEPRTRSKIDWTLEMEVWTSRLENQSFWVLPRGRNILQGWVLSLWYLVHFTLHEILVFSDQNENKNTQRPRSRAHNLCSYSAIQNVKTNTFGICREIVWSVVGLIMWSWEYNQIVVSLSNKKRVVKRSTHSPISRILQFFGPQVPCQFQLFPRPKTRKPKTISACIPTSITTVHSATYTAKSIPISSRPRWHVDGCSWSAGQTVAYSKKTAWIRQHRVATQTTKSRCRVLSRR